MECETRVPVHVHVGTGNIAEYACEYTTLCKLLFCNLYSTYMYYAVHVGKYFQFPT